MIELNEEQIVIPFGKFPSNWSVKEFELYDILDSLSIFHFPKCKKCKEEKNVDLREEKNYNWIFGNEKKKVLRENKKLVCLLPVSQAEQATFKENIILQMKQNGNVADIRRNKSG